MNQFFRQTLGKENTKKDIFSLINQEKSSSREKVIGYLKEMGIETGFLTIKVGDVEKVYYYTTHEYSIPVKSKERYDEQYQGLTNTTYGPVSIFRDFPPNATIEGKECNYTINEKGGLDIPYGADVWDLKWPHPSKG